MSIIQKDYYYNNNLEINTWDNFWKNRPMLQNFQVNKLESTLQILFRSYISKGDKIIEAGCGLGQWVIFLKHYGYNIIGIDNNEFAISSIKEFDDSIKVELGEVLNIQYPNNSFDAYISIGVVEHFEEGPISALKEAYRVLNPNGLIFVSVPTINIIRKLIKRPIRKIIQSLWGKKNPLALFTAIKRVLPWNRGKYYHFMEYRISPKELENFLKQCNFKVILTIPRDNYDSREHHIGLTVDFPFLGDPKDAFWRLNSLGKLIARILDKISPWIACSSVLCIGRSLKKLKK